MASRRTLVRPKRHLLGPACQVNRFCRCSRRHQRPLPPSPCPFHYGLPCRPKALDLPSRRPARNCPGNPAPSGARRAGGGKSFGSAVSPARIANVPDKSGGTGGLVSCAFDCAALIMITAPASTVLITGACHSFHRTGTGRKTRSVPLLPEGKSAQDSVATLAGEWPFVRSDGSSVGRDTIRLPARCYQVWRAMGSL